MHGNLWNKNNQHPWMEDAFYTRGLLELLDLPAFTERYFADWALPYKARGLTINRDGSVSKSTPASIASVVTKRAKIINAAYADYEHFVAVENDRRAHSQTRRLAFA